MLNHEKHSERIRGLSALLSLLHNTCLYLHRKNASMFQLSSLQVTEPHRIADSSTSKEAMLSNLLLERAPLRFLLLSIISITLLEGKVFGDERIPLRVVSYKVHLFNFLWVHFYDGKERCQLPKPIA